MKFIKDLPLYEQLPLVIGHQNWLTYVTASLGLVGLLQSILFMPHPRAEKAQIVAAKCGSSANSVILFDSKTISSSVEALNIAPSNHLTYCNK